MITKIINGVTALYAEGENKITDKDRKIFVDYLFLGKNDIIDNYDEVEKDIWKNYVKIVDPEIKQVKNQINELKDEVNEKNIENNQLIDTLLLAIDNLYNFIGEDLETSEVSRSIKSTSNKTNQVDQRIMVYILMVQRGLKKIEDIPEEYKKIVLTSLKK